MVFCFQRKTVMGLNDRDDRLVRHLAQLFQSHLGRLDRRGRVDHHQFVLALDHGDVAEATVGRVEVPVPMGPDLDHFRLGEGIVFGEDVGGASMTGDIAG